MACSWLPQSWGRSLSAGSAPKQVSRIEPRACEVGFLNSDTHIESVSISTFPLQQEFNNFKKTVLYDDMVIFELHS